MTGEAAPQAGIDTRLLEILFVDAPPPQVRNLPVDFFSPTLLRSWLVAESACSADASDEAVVGLYLAGLKHGRISPNPWFDEAWYRLNNPDVAAEIAKESLSCGFVHFVNYGLGEGRWPNPSLRAMARDTAERPVAEWLDAEQYVSGNGMVRGFLKAFPWLTPLQHYNLYGRFLGCAPNGSAGPGLALEQVFAEIDVAFYRRRYMSGLPADASVVEHYMTIGVREMADPNPWFDEGWYRAFYPDVRSAVADGVIPFGFYHFILFGREEGRIPAHDLARALEVKLPGVTQPTLLLRLDGVRKKLAVDDGALTVGAASGPVRVWFVMPVLNPDISFGGYQAAFALMIALRRAGFRIGLFCTEEERPNLDYFLWRQARPDYDEAFAGCLLLGQNAFSDIPVHRGDLAVAYSVWGLPAAARLASAAGARLPYLLAQEYEPIFYENDTLRVLCESLYEIPHVPLINSPFLLRFFRGHGVGPFASSAERSDGFHVFEHRINRLHGQTADEMRARQARILVAYARPEMHAGRNLFEMIVIALERLCDEGAFGPEWSFVGLGALTRIDPVRLGPKHVLRMVMKMDEADYRSFMGQVDIGLSLMCAPHPSVVPFELATTGALVVTNVYENRTAEDLQAISGNIVPCRLGIAPIMDAIRQAIARVEDFEDREMRTFRPATLSWREIFDADALQTMFGMPDPASGSAPSS